MGNLIALTARESATYAQETAPPTVGEVTPSFGPEAGGTEVTIKGSGFLAGATVTIGSEATVDEVVSSDEIKATTKAHAPGAEEVVVETTNGKSTLGPSFTYEAPRRRRRSASHAELRPRSRRHRGDDQRQRLPGGRHGHDRLRSDRRRSGLLRRDQGHDQGPRPRRRGSRRGRRQRQIDARCELHLRSSPASAASATAAATTQTPSWRPPSSSSPDPPPKPSSRALPAGAEAARAPPLSG